MRSRATLLLLLFVPLLLPAAHAADAPVWIWVPDNDTDRHARLLGEAGIEANHLANLGMIGLRAPADFAARLVQEHGGTLWQNEQHPLHLDESVPAIGADQVQAAIGSQRNGPTVLLVDSGVDGNHPDFQDGNLAANIGVEAANGLATGVREDGPVVDPVGHGTHVGGIIAGSGDGLGPQDPASGLYSGVYSIGRLVSFQATIQSRDNGVPAVDSLAALTAFDWALSNQDRFDIRVVNNAWGLLGPFDPDHPINQATLRLYQSGVTVLFSAGNGGEGAPLNRHCQAPWVLCVTGSDLRGNVGGYASTGRPPGPGVPEHEHPDLAAPGSAIRSTIPLQQTGDLDPLPGSDGILYGDQSGTSMGVAHASAAAALLQAANPTLSPDQVMELLIGNAAPAPEPVHQGGAGMLDVLSAHQAALATAGERSPFLSGAHRYDATSGDAVGGALAQQTEGEATAWIFAIPSILLALAAAGTATAGFAASRR